MKVQAVVLCSYSYEEDDEYYSKAGGNTSSTVTQPTGQNWHGGHYENFEVRWTREPEYGGQFRGPPPVMVGIQSI